MADSRCTLFAVPSDTTTTTRNPAILAGFEWEFLVAHNDHGIDYHPDDERWFSRPNIQQAQSKSTSNNPNDSPFMQMIRSSSCKNVLSKVEDVLLEQANLLVLDDSDYLGKHGRSEEVQQALFMNGLDPTKNVHPEYMVYSTSADNSLHAMDSQSTAWMDERYRWRGCEIQSRVFTEDEITPTPQTPGSDSNKDESICFREVTRLCTSLRANLRLQINHTCALQVTLSHQQDGGFNLLNLKKILTLAWILEPMLFALCAPHRRDDSSMYARPIRESSELASTRLHETAESLRGYHDPLSLEAVMERESGGVSYWERQFLSHVGAPIAGLLIQLASSSRPSPQAPSSDSHLTSSQKENQHPSAFYSNPQPEIKNINFGPAKGNNLNTTLALSKSLEKLTHHLKQIWLAPTAACLASMMQEHSYHDMAPAAGGYCAGQRIGIAVKFLGSSSPTSTALEFRMHEGTLDPVLSKMWMDVCLALVKKATLPPGSSFASGSSSSAPYGMQFGGGSEVRDYAFMIRGFVEKMVGLESADDVYSRKEIYGYTPPDMLKDLGIGQAEVKLWEKKITSFHQSQSQPQSRRGRSESFALPSVPAAPRDIPSHMHLAIAGWDDAMTQQSIDRRLACANLPVDISCFAGGRYRDWSFLPPVCLDLDYELEPEPGNGIFLTPPRRNDISEDRGCVFQPDDERHAELSGDDEIEHQCGIVLDHGWGDDLLGADHRGNDHKAGGRSETDTPHLSASIFSQESDLDLDLDTSPGPETPMTLEGAEGLEDLKDMDGRKSQADSVFSI